MNTGNYSLTRKVLLVTKLRHLFLPEKTTMADRLHQLLHLLKESADDSFLLFALAKEYEQREDYSQALKCYLRIRESDPSYVGLYYHLGKLYELLGCSAEAIEAYQAGIRQAAAAGDTHAKSELSSALMELED